MSKNYNGVLLKHLFQLAEQDKQDEKIDQLLQDTIKDVVIKPESINIEFKNGVHVEIISDFESFKIYISDHKFYSNGDSAYSPIGQDRVMFYLKSIANFKYSK